MFGYFLCDKRKADHLPAAYDQAAEDVHGSRAEAPEEDEGEAVSTVLDEIAHIFKGGEGEGNRDAPGIRPSVQY